MVLGVTGLFVVTAAIMMQIFQKDISWAWTAVVVLAGMHTGVVMLLLAGVMRWLTGRRSGRQAS